MDYKPTKFQFSPEGPEYTLQLTWRAIREIREETGINLFNQDITNSLYLDYIPALIAAMIRHQDDSMTTRKVEDLLNIGNMTEVIKAFLTCLGVDMPAPTEEEKEEAEDENEEEEAGKAKRPSRAKKTRS